MGKKVTLFDKIATLLGKMGTILGKIGSIMKKNPKVLHMMAEKEQKSLKLLLLSHH